MVRQQYFTEHLEQFKAIARGKPINFISTKTPAFVTIPLVQRKHVPLLQYNSMDKVFLPLYENHIRALHYQRRLLVSPYVYLLGVHSLFGKQFILRRLITKNIGNLLRRGETVLSDYYFLTIN